MKRCRLSLIAVIVLCMLLCGCGGEKDVPPAEPTETPAAAVETPQATFRPDEGYVPEEENDVPEDDTATEDPEGEQIADAPDEETYSETADDETGEKSEGMTEDGTEDAAEWTLVPFSNATLQVKFKYPDGWTSDPSVDTITFVEPVDEGDTGARFSITSYEFTGAKPSSSLLKNELGGYLKKLYKSYSDSKTGKVQSNITIADSKAMHCDYVAVKGNSYVKGFVGMGYGKNNRVYVMHFLCLEEDYEYFKPLIFDLSQSIEVMTGK